MGLQQFEQRLERLVEGAFSRAFRAGLQPVEIGRRLTREMDLLRRVGVNGLYAPNSFVVELSPQDSDRFESFADALARELADAAREHARVEGYEFLGPIEVEIQRSTRLRTGTACSSPQYIAHKVAPMHQPSSGSSSAPLARSVSRTPQCSSSQT